MEKNLRENFVKRRYETKRLCRKNFWSRPFVFSP